MKTHSLDCTDKGYDLIGDIHGYAEPLRRMLTKLGYSESNGCFRHPSRKVIFLGDFIDRGPEIREALRIVRSMVDSGAALAVMGNHEFNALCYHTVGMDGKPLRAHSDKNLDQHKVTLAAFAELPDEWRDYLAWFRTLPLFLDMGEFRVVHAAWDDSIISKLEGGNKLDERLLHKAAKRDTPEYEMIEVLLKGREIRLPDGHRFTDKEGCKRSKIRTRWWLNGKGRTYREVVFPRCDDMPATTLPADVEVELPGYSLNAAPVFVGHYWLPGNDPKTPVTTNVACLDYSVAKKGSLVAYRWNGSGPLKDDGFVAVE
jgi:hypothetical protein